MKKKMKKKLLFCCIVLTAAILSGCRKEKQGTENGGSVAEEVTVDKPEEEAGENREDGERQEAVEVPGEDAGPEGGLEEDIEPEMEPEAAEPKEEVAADRKHEEAKSFDYETLSVIDRIQKGDFSCLTDGYWDRENVEEYYATNWARAALEWVRYDLNGDGMEDLIWQEREPVDGMNRIVGIFACYEEHADCVLLDFNDNTAFYFLSATQNFIYYTYSSGQVTVVQCQCYRYDESWNKELVYSLEAYGIDDADEVYNKEYWEEECPGLLEEGEYFSRVTGAIRGSGSIVEKLEQEEFLELFRELTGLEFTEYYSWPWSFT